MRFHTHTILSVSVLSTRVRLRPVAPIVAHPCRVCCPPQSLQRDGSGVIAIVDSLVSELLSGAASALTPPALSTLLASACGGGTSTSALHAIGAFQRLLGPSPLSIPVPANFRGLVTAVKQGLPSGPAPHLAPRVRVDVGPHLAVAAVGGAGSDDAFLPPEPNALVRRWLCVCMNLCV